MSIKATYTWEAYKRLTSVGCLVRPPQCVRNAPRLEMQQAGLCLIQEIRLGVAFIFDLKSSHFLVLLRRLLRA